MPFDDSLIIPFAEHDDLLERVEDLPQPPIDNSLAILEAVNELKATLNNLDLPVPIVNVEKPDLSDIVTAVTSLRPNAEPEDIAQVIVEKLTPDQTVEDKTGPALGEVADALKKLDFRMQGMGAQAYGGGSVNATISPTGTDPLPISGNVEVSNDEGNALPVRDVLAAVNKESRLDYQARTDTNPVYVGKADNGTAESAATWTVQKLTYDASNRLTRLQTLTGRWDQRTTLGWT